MNFFQNHNTIYHTSTNFFQDRHERRFIVFQPIFFKIVMKNILFISANFFQNRHERRFIYFSEFFQIT